MIKANFPVIHCCG